MKKRSVQIAGHATSITLEDEFWLALKDLAKEHKISINALVTKIDKSRKTDNLSSGLRLFVLKSLQEKLNQKNDAKT